MERSRKFLSFILKVIVLSFSLPLSASTLEVCSSCQYKTITEALLTAKPHDTIHLKSEIFHESKLEIKTPVTLEGEAGTVIDGQEKGQILTVKSPKVTLRNFTIQNTGINYVEDVSAIRIDEVSDCAIDGVKVRNTFFGIYLAKASYCRIENNRIEGPNWDESKSGNGIHIWKAQNIVIKKNEISGHRDGIYFEFVSDSLIEDNLSQKNLRYGLHFMFSDRDKYFRNHFVNNGVGVAVMYSRAMQMRNNFYGQSWGSAAFGLLLKDIYDSQISDNTFEENTIAIYMEGSNRSQFHRNRIAKNGWALKILGNCDNNHFEDNNFIDNTFEVSTNSSNSPNSFDKNYWSSYKGLDLNGDGFGDLSFRPVRLSTVLMEQYGITVVLLKSFFFAMIDEAEAMLPIITPPDLQDPHPRMQELK